MTLRSPVNQADIQHFLRRLGDTFRSPGRVYLVGGTTLVLDGYRKQTIFGEILPQMGRRSLKQNPDEFESNFRALETMWRAAGGQT